MVSMGTRLMHTRCNVHSVVEVLRSAQKFKRPPVFCKNYVVEVTFNGITCLLNYTKIYQLF
jgi:hypothetical protein